LSDSIVRRAKRAVARRGIATTGDKASRGL